HHTRNGQSTWNKQNLFTGWGKDHLSERGKTEARGCTEAARTALVICPTWRTPRFYGELSILPMLRLMRSIDIGYGDADRHYGDLQNQNKAEAAHNFGDNQVKLWRRSYDIRPRPLRDDMRYSRQMLNMRGLRQDSLQCPR
ncbi:hypothetical protein LLEC1_00058, partial [Akanthomyces lecanii]